MMQQLGWRSLEQRRADIKLAFLYIYVCVYGLVAIPSEENSGHLLQFPPNIRICVFLVHQVLIPVGFLEAASNENLSDTSTSTRDQQCKSNPRPFDLQSNAQLLYHIIPTSELVMVCEHQTTGTIKST